MMGAGHCQVKLTPGATTSFILPERNGEHTGCHSSGDSEGSYLLANLRVTLAIIPLVSTLHIYGQGMQELTI